MNKAKVIRWYDDVNPDSFVICAPNYGLKVLQAKYVHDNEVEIVVYGLAEDVDRFAADVEDGSVEPLESMGRDLEFDEDYEAWLNNEVNRMLDLAEQEYNPSYEDLDMQYREEPDMA